MQYAIKDVFETTFKDYVTQKPLFYIDYGQVSNLQFTADNTPINGGHGNQRLYIFDANKQSSLQLTNALFDDRFLAAITGGQLQTGAVNLFEREVLKIQEDGTVRLKHVPTGHVYVGTLEYSQRNFEDEIVEGDPATDENVYAIEDDVLTFNTDSNPANTYIGVMYEYLASENTRTISIDADKFGGIYTIEGKGLWDDQKTGERHISKFVIYKAKPQSEFNINMSASDPATLECTFDILSDQSEGRARLVDIFVTEELDTTTPGGGQTVDPTTTTSTTAAPATTTSTTVNP